MSQSIFVFKVNQLGDSVAFLPTLQQLYSSAATKNLSLHVWTTPIASSVLNFNPTLTIHQTPLHEFNRSWKKPHLCQQILRQVRKTHPTACLLDWDQGNIAHLAAFLSGAKTISGGTNHKVLLNRYITHRPIPNRQQPAPQWSWDIGKHFAQKFFGEQWAPTPPPPDLTHLITSTPTTQTPKQKPILIHPGASSPHKRMPIDLILTLASRLAQHHPVTLIQPRELPPLSPPPTIPLISPTTIPELVTTIANSSMLIGNNSGPMNFAFALGIPSVIFWGPSDPAWRATWQPEKHLSLTRNELPCIACELTYHDNQCHNPAEPIACMNRWQVDEVFTACMDWHQKWTPPTA